MKLKCEELTKTIMECFDNSMDNRFTTEERKEFLVNGKRLRGSLINLLSADFNEETAEIIESNNLIKEINVSLKEKDRMLDNAAVVVDNITKLVSILDDLLKLAASFV
jgi:hypothetical protein